MAVSHYMYRTNHTDVSDLDHLLDLTSFYGVFEVFY